MSDDSQQEIAAALLELGSATLGESGGLATDRRLRPAWSGAALAAPAYPVGCTPGDNLAVHVAVTTAPAGSVLVVDVGRVPDRGYWGEVLTTAAEAAGLAGLVIDGGVRDLARLDDIGMPVFSRRVCMRGTAKAQDGDGTLRSPVTLGGIVVRHGDLVVGDGDGVVVLPADLVPGIIAAAQARQRKESEYISKIQSGYRTLDLYGLEP
jgi:4-hydroxy-4-methyl-2-oxoglutarate aldolase